MNRWIYAAAGAALLVSTQAASPQTFNQAIVFGDSTVDSGWFRWTARDCAQARIDAAILQGGTVKPVGVGLMNSEVLAGYFGLSANPANAPGGGTNYAISGARTDNLNLCGGAGAQASPSTTQQVVNYLASVGGKANPNALYLIGTGGNDITFALDSLAPAARNAYIIDAANDLVKIAADLKAAGAKYVIVRNQVNSFGSANARALRALFNTTLWSGLAAAGVNVIPADFNAVRVAIAANPSAFGFTSIAVSDESNIGPSPSACSPPTNPPNSPAGHVRSVRSSLRQFHGTERDQCLPDVGEFSADQSVLGRRTSVGRRAEAAGRLLLQPHRRPKPNLVPGGSPDKDPRRHRERDPQPDSAVVPAAGSLPHLGERRSLLSEDE